MSSSSHTSRSEASSSESSSSEDDDGVLVSGPLDDQVNATLRAIKTKDPRIYDDGIKFYASDNEDVPSDKKSRSQPMSLNDYHRRNLLEGPSEKADTDASPTYIQQQESLKDVVKEMHENAKGGDDDEDDGDGFFARKSPPAKRIKLSAASTPAAVRVEEADEDPERYLANYMSARAWVPTAEAQYQPFESDDEEEDQRAEDFEAAYNLRFEDPSNEKLTSHSRTFVAKHSVRREEPSSRKKVREEEIKERKKKKKPRWEDTIAISDLEPGLEGKAGEEQGGGFKYRETSPVSFGLTARDILMASDSQLNQFAGVKKLATWRAPEQKRKDKRHLGKKARLRQWRKETFGREEGPDDTTPFPS